MTTRVNRWLLLTLVVLAGCPERQAVVPAPVVAAPVVVAAADAGAGVTAQKLEAWLAYHRQLRALVGDDGGALEAKVKARRERELREALSLSEADVDRLEDAIGAIVAQRTISRLTGAEAVKEFDTVTLGLKPEQRQKVEQAFGEVRTRAQQVASLDAERAKFGDDTVTVILAREAEVTQTWDSLLDTRGERR